jgi:hypothetical protein
VQIRNVDVARFYTAWRLVSRIDAAAAVVEFIATAVKNLVTGAPSP